MLKNIIFIIFSVILTISCSRTYRLSKSDFEWQPYKKGDILVFKSIDNERDTIFINGIKSYLNPDDPMMPKEYNETLFISGERSLSKPRKQAGHLFYREYIDILEVFSGEENTYLTFVFKKKSDTLSYPTTVLSIDNLKYKFKEKSKLSHNSILIEAKDYYDLNFEYDLNFFWWSKQFGYVRYEFKNGIYWELEKFIRKGVNILDK